MAAEVLPSAYAMAVAVVVYETLDTLERALIRRWRAVGDTTVWLHYIDVTLYRCASRGQHACDDNQVPHRRPLCALQHLDDNRLDFNAHTICALPLYYIVYLAIR